MVIEQGVFLFPPAAFVTATNDPAAAQDPPGEKHKDWLYPNSNRVDKDIALSKQIQIRFPCNVKRQGTSNGGLIGGWSINTNYLVTDQCGAPLDGVGIDEHPEIQGPGFEGSRRTGSGVSKEGGIFTDEISIITGAIQKVKKIRVNNPIDVNYGEYKIKNFSTIIYDQYATQSDGDPTVQYQDGL